MPSDVESFRCRVQGSKQPVAMSALLPQRKNFGQGSDQAAMNIWTKSSKKTWIKRLITCLVKCTIPKATELKTEERLASCLWTSGLKGPPGDPIKTSVTFLKCCTHNPSKSLLSSFTSFLLLCTASPHHQQEHECAPATTLANPRAVTTCHSPEFSENDPGKPLRYSRRKDRVIPIEDEASLLHADCKLLLEENFEECCTLPPLQRCRVFLYRHEHHKEPKAVLMTMIVTDSNQYNDRDNNNDRKEV